LIVCRGEGDIASIESLERHLTNHVVLRVCVSYIYFLENSFTNLKGFEPPTSHEWERHLASCSIVHSISYNLLLQRENIGTYTSPSINQAFIHDYFMIYKQDDSVVDIC
jgi:hypothetical protein